MKNCAFTVFDQSTKQMLIPFLSSLVFCFYISTLCNSPAISRILKVPTLEMGAVNLREITYLAKDATGAKILTEICQTLKAIVLLLTSETCLGL